MAGCDNVVDVGSGQGYLSRALAFQYNWPVVALEMDKANVRAASPARAHGLTAWVPRVAARVPRVAA